MGNAHWHLARALRVANFVIFPMRCHTFFSRRRKLNSTQIHKTKLRKITILLLFLSTTPCETIVISSQSQLNNKKRKFKATLGEKGLPCPMEQRRLHRTVEKGSETLGFKKKRERILSLC